MSFLQLSLVGIRQYLTTLYICLLRRTLKPGSLVCRCRLCPGWQGTSGKVPWTTYKGHKDLWPSQDTWRPCWSQGLSWKSLGYSSHGWWGCKSSGILLYWAPPWSHQFKLLCCHCIMIKGTRYLGLCYGKPAVDLERKAFLTVKVRVSRECKGDPLGDWSCLWWRRYSPSSESLGWHKCDPQTAPKWSHCNAGPFTGFICSIFQIMPYITLYPAQIFLWHF